MGRSRVILVASAIGLLAAAPARSTFAGSNGALAYSAFRNGKTEIYSLTPGRRPKQLTTDKAPKCCPEWSPDGRKLSFLRDGVSLMNANGTGLRALKTAPGSVGRASWSADGRFIYYSLVTQASIATDGLQQIRNVSIDGTRDRLVYAAQKDQILNGAMGISGGGVAFLRRRSGAIRSELCLLRADGTHLHVAATGPFADFDVRGNRFPTIEWDGTVSIRTLDGMPLRTVPAPIEPGGVFRVRFSPDGASILYTGGQRGPRGSQSALKLIPVNGTRADAKSLVVIRPDFAWQPRGVPAGPPLPRR
jgi:dipeptidyl aminopeptidase/acylaminoacyl peptidase